MTTPVHRGLQALRRRRPHRSGTARPLAGLVRLAMTIPLGLPLIALSGIGHRGFAILAQFTAPALAGTAILSLLLALFRLRTALIGLVSCLALLAAVGPQWFPGGPRP